MNDPLRVDLDAASRRALEFDALLDAVAGEARTSAGAEIVRRLAPFACLQDLRREGGRVAEARHHLVREGALVPGGLADTRASLRRLSVDDARLTALELREIALSLDVVVRIRGALARGPGDRLLCEHLDPVPDFTAEIAPILGAVEPDGRIGDAASPRLAELRGRRLRLAGRLRRKLEALLRDPQTVGAIRDDFVTQRNGRYVIPVRTDAAQPVRGIVHALSSSGATRFIEPLDSVELNNDLVQLAEQEKEEQERLLLHWSNSLRERLDAVSDALRRLAELDAIQARASWGERVGAVTAHVEAAGALRLIGLRHPLLERHLEESGGSCVPLDLQLDPADRVLVVSGPNTGGKTVALKSIGLAALMAQSGIPVPAKEARLPLYEQVRADIGDPQSIEADLSTFSGHLTAICGILSRRRSPALLLFDEIGTGTDPAEGGALAQAVLEKLAGPGVTVVATTHQNTLKHWAFADTDATSAAMEFDDQTLRPTYRVLPGVVGPSAALDIAARCGLPSALIARARELLGEDAGRAEAFMNRLRDELSAVEGERRERERQHRTWQAERSADEERRRKQELGERTKTVRALDREIVEFRKQVRRALASVREPAERRRAEKAAHTAEQRLKAQRERVAAEGGNDAAENWACPEHIRSGMTVHVLSMGKLATVQSSAGDRIEVRLGRMTMSVDRADLRLPPHDPQPVPDVAKRPRRSARDLGSGPPRELKLVGQRVEAALHALDRCLDRAVLDAVGEIRVIHGHGTGRLRRAIREYLRTHSAVAQFRRGGDSEGGDGATIVSLK